MPRSVDLPARPPLHADQAAGDQGPEEIRPERLGLGDADVQPDDLSAPGLVHAVGDDHALALHPATVADLLDLGVEKQIKVAALKRPQAKRLDLLIQPAQIGLTSLRRTRSPRLSTSWSTRRVDTPQT